MSLDVVFGHYLADETKTFSFALDRAPHMLVAGMTGSGKSVFINSLLLQLVRNPPTQLRLLLLDPKRVELAPYAGLPHLLDQPLWDPRAMRNGLYWLIHEMNERFELLAAQGARNIDDFNNHEPDPAKRLPAIVCVVDELANLILGDKAVEPLVVTLTTMGRAAGIHLLLATQSPRADVLTGLIRANVPTRVAFATVTAMESKIILDEPGAEKLPGKGAMLVRVAGSRILQPLQGEMVSLEQIERAAQTHEEVRIAAVA